MTTCRYCGLLDASVAAHERAIGLEPKLKTSIIHTWAFQGAHDRVATFRPQEFPYLVPLAMPSSDAKPRRWRRCGRSSRKFRRAYATW